MKKFLALLTAILLSLGLFAGCAKDNKGGSSNSSDGAKATKLNIYAWADMFPAEFLSDFEKSANVTLNYSPYPSGEEMLTKLKETKGGDYDLIIADDYIIELAIKEGLVQKLDKSKIPNYSNINPIYQGFYFDKNNDYTVPHGAGIQTIVYNPKNIDFEITKYADLWDARLKDKIGITQNARVMTGMGLKMLGKSYNTNDVKDIEAAGNKLAELAPNIRLINDNNLHEGLLSGEFEVGVMYTSQATMAMVENPELKTVFPEEGIGFGLMAAFIPSNAPNPDAAYKFLNNMLDAEKAAKAFEFLGYYSTNKAAEAYISDKMKGFLTLPADFDMSNMEMIENIGNEAMDAHNVAWTKFIDATK